jgi:stage V sporulation protein D (sporulation-specific penicillin-binding protein)
MRPRLVEKIIHGNGTEEVVPSESVRRVVSEETAHTMGDMLRSVVVNGHGKRADVPGYLVGGKTGTAQVAKNNEKGYDEKLSIGSFVGYAPINDPRFAIAVKFDNPKNVEWAESSAAPVFGKMMKFLLEYYQIEPTETIRSK